MYEESATHEIAPTASEAKGLSRRQLVKAGVWAAPVVVAGTASPAAAVHRQPIAVTSSRQPVLDIRRSGRQLHPAIPGRRHGISSVAANRILDEREHGDRDPRTALRRCWTADISLPTPRQRVQTTLAESAPWTIADRASRHTSSAAPGIQRCLSASAAPTARRLLGHSPARCANVSTAAPATPDTATAPPRGREPQSRTGTTPADLGTRCPGRSAGAVRRRVTKHLRWNYATTCASCARTGSASSC